MEQQVPELFDFVKAEQAESRARRLGAETFLLDRMAEDLPERLAPVLREFTQVLDFGTPDGAFARAFRAMKPGVAPDIRSGIAALTSEAGLQPSRYDLILSGMLLHRINDLPGLLIQLRRALKPDGLLLAVFPGGDTLTELRDSLMRAESEVRGAAGLRVFPMTDIRVAGQLLQRAGLALPVVDSEKVTVRYGNLLALIRDLRAMGATANALIRPGQPALTRRIFLRATEIYGQEHADPDGRIRATFEFIWLSGWAPHESQQKPLKPGSAAMRLQDALKTPAPEGWLTERRPITDQ